MDRMNTLRERSRAWVRSPIGVGAFAFLLGTVFGLVILGWWLWPVEYTGAAPDVLYDYYQTEYLRMTLDSYGLTGDANLARTRFQQLGLHGPQRLSELYNDPAADKSKLDKFINAVGAVPASAQAPLPSSPTPAAALGIIASLSENWAGVGIAVLVFLVLIAAGIVTVLRLARRRSFGSNHADEEELSFETEEARGVVVSALKDPSRAGPTGEGQPLERFVTTYVLGDDLYEDSFTINSAAGEFLGECGVGISEPIGVGEPKKVTAFEIWLFDRKESKSSTTVLMSPYAFGKEDLKASLAPRGQPLLASAGSDFWMETQNLQLRVNIREIQFGREPLPENSYFDRALLQLEVWVR
jgi:hypothetical protein